MHLETACVSGRLLRNEPKCHRLPIYASNTYKQDSYARYKNPNREALEQAFSNLYHCEEMQHPACCAVSSGTGAFASVLEAGSRQKANKTEIIVDENLYFEVMELVRFFEKSYIINVVDTSDKAALEQALSENTQFVFIDVRPFPLYTETDVKGIAALVHEKAPNAKVVADNSNLSIYCYNPFIDGADIVVESLGKYCCGHGDAMGGVILNYDTRSAINVFGNGIDAFSSWLILRGISTLPVRMKKAIESADSVYGYLTKELGLKNVNRCAAVITFQVPEESPYRSAEDIKKHITSKFSIILNEYSFGQDNTTCMVEHVKGGNYIRLAIGLENAEDLIADLKTVLPDAIRP